MQADFSGIGCGIFYFTDVTVDLSGWHPAYPLGQACERVEDAGQEDDRAVCGEHASGRDSADWRRACLL